MQALYGAADGNLIGVIVHCSSHSHAERPPLAMWSSNPTKSVSDIDVLFAGSTAHTAQLHARHSSSIVSNSPTLHNSRTRSHDMSRLVHRNTPLAQIRSRLLNLFHQLLVRFGDIVERKDSIAEFGQKVCAEGYNGPEGNL
jgi:hypothetical protein